MEEARFREVVALRIAPGPVHQGGEEQDRNVGQHQAGQDLVGFEARLQPSRDRRPGHATRRAEDDHRRQQERALHLVEGKRETAAGNRPDGELSLGADVPDVGAKAERQADSDEDDRRRLHEKLGETIKRADRRDEKLVEPLQRTAPHEREDGGSAQNRERHGEKRRGIDPDLRGLATGLEPNQHGRPPPGPTPWRHGCRP